MGKSICRPWLAGGVGGRGLMEGWVRLPGAALTSRESEQKPGVPKPDPSGSD